MHETTHFTEGTNEWLDVTNYVFGKDGSGVTSLIDRVKNSGYGVTQDDVDAVLTAVKEGKLSEAEFTETQRTLVSEVVAMQMEEIFADERLVEHLVNDNASLAKRIWERIKALVESFGKSKEQRQELQNLRKTEELFRKALQNAGVEYIEGEIKKSAEDQADGEVKHLKKGNKDYFVEDKYFESQIQKWDSLQHGSYVKVGQINNGHPLVKVGMPQGIIKYDVDKLNKNMTKHAYLNEKLLKAIPDIIADPIAISEYTAENTVSVFGDIFVGSSPMMVGVTISKDRAGVNISKVRTYNARRDVGTLITNDSVLYLNEDKKRTRTWFQACGIQVPLGETRFGFIRSISQKDSNVNKQSKKSHPNIKHSHKESSDYSLSAEEKQSLNKELSELASSVPSTPAKNKKPQSKANSDTRSFAQRNSDKVYTRKDAKTILDNILGENLGFDTFYGKLSSKSQKEATEWIYEALNKAEPGKRAGIAQNIAEFIMQSAILEEIYDIEDVTDSIKTERLDLLKEYFHRIDLDRFKQDIKERYGDDSEKLYKLFGKMRDTKGVNAETVASELSAQGWQIEAENEIDIFFKIADSYLDYTESITHCTAFIDHVLSEEDRAARKNEIANAFLRGFDYTGEASLLAKERNMYEDKIEELKKDFKSQLAKRYDGKIENLKDKAQTWKDKYYTKVESDKVGNRVLYKAKKIGDLKNGRFLSASRFKTDIFKNSIESLSKINYRGNLNESGIRKILAGLAQWYDPKGNPLLAGSNFDEDIYYALQFISTGEGNLSLDELKALEDIIDYFMRFSNNYNKIRRNGELVDALPIAKSYIDIIRENGEYSVGALRKFFVEKYGRTFFDPMTLVRYMDGYQHGFYTDMLERLREGAVNAQIMEMELREPLEKFYEKNKKYLSDIRKRTIKYQDRDIPVTQAMLLYMTLKRDQALAGLAASGFSLFDGKNEIDFKGFANGQDLSLLDPKEKAKILQDELKKQFSNADIEYISIVEKLFNDDCKRIKEKTDIERKGRSNVLNDYYVPIVRATIAKTVDASTFFDEMMRVSNASFNKDIVEGAKNKLYIESIDKVIDRHIKALSLYANLATAIDDYNTLYNLDVSENLNDPESIASQSSNSMWNRSVKRQVGDRVRDEANEFFKKMISDIQGISPVKGDGTRFIGKIRSNYARFQLGFNLKVLATQCSSFFAAGSILDYDSILKGFSVSGKDVDKYCPLAKLRHSENTVALAQGVLDKTGKLGDKLMIGIGVVDRLVVIRLFAACQIQISKEKRLAIGTEENKKAAGELLKRVILETQQNSLATERSAAMRSGNEFFKTLTMFSADAMKVIGRFIDSLGEYWTLTKKKKKLSDPAAIKEIDLRLKTVKRNLAKSTASLVSSAIVMALIAQAFRTLYNKDDEDDNVWANMGIDAAGNLLGGLPLYKDLFSFYLDGYELENYAYSTVNDLLDSFRDILNINDGRSAMAAVKSVFFASGQLFGIPTRNVYNFFYGLTNRISPSSTYTWDNMLYNKNYSSDLAKAIENEDEDMIATIAGLMLNENVGGIESEAARTELNRLVTKGFDVIPRGVSDTVTYDGETYELTSREKKEFSKIYNIANESLADMVKLARYKEATDEVKQKAIAFVYDVYYKLALQDFLGEDLETKTVLFAEAIDIEKLALIVATARSLTADTDKDGKTVSGSRKKKVLAYINSLRLTAAEKYMVAGYLGYKNVKGEAQVKAHINTLNLTKSEKSKLLEYSA